MLFSISKGRKKSMLTQINFDLLGKLDLRMDLKMVSKMAGQPLSVICWKRLLPSLMIYKRPFFPRKIRTYWKMALSVRKSRIHRAIWARNRKFPVIKIQEPALSNLSRFLFVEKYTSVHFPVFNSLSGKPPHTSAPESFAPESASATHVQRTPTRNPRGSAIFPFGTPSW